MLKEFEKEYKISKLNNTNCVGGVGAVFWPEQDKQVRDKMVAYFEESPLVKNGVQCTIIYIQEEAVTKTYFSFKEMTGQQFRNAFKGGVEIVLEMANKHKEENA